jgi:Ner family transcriptional regulator
MFTKGNTKRRSPTLGGLPGASMKQQPADWHPEDVKAAIRKTGTTLAALSRAAGLSAGAGKRCLIVAWPRVEAVIACHLGTVPQSIWPTRYDAFGRPLRGLRAIDSGKPSRPGQSPHRQKLEAA